MPSGGSRVARGAGRPARRASLLRSRAAILASLAASVAGAVVAGGLLAVAENDPQSGPAGAIAALVPQSDPRSLSGDAFAGAMPGRCLDWAATAQSELTGFTTVPCAAPHRFEVARRIDLVQVPDFAPGTTFPGTEQHPAIAAQFCAPEVDRYTGGRPVDPEGRFAVTVVPPSAAGWDRGDHSVLCGLTTPGLDGRPAQSSGAYVESDQHRHWEPGTCLGFTAQRLPGDPVDCTEPHSVEVVSDVDVTPLYAAGAEVPSPRDQAAASAEACRAAGAEYLGGAENLRRSTLISTLVVPISQVSWATGSRHIDCGLMRAQPQGGFAELQGSARSGLTVDGQAPVAPTTTTLPVPPGAEAPATGSPQDPMARGSGAMMAPVMSSTPGVPAGSP